MPSPKYCRFLRSLPRPDGIALEYRCAITRGEHERADCADVRAELCHWSKCLRHRNGDPDARPSEPLELEAWVDTHALLEEAGAPHLSEEQKLACLLLKAGIDKEDEELRNRRMGLNQRKAHLRKLWEGPADWADRLYPPQGSTPLPAPNDDPGVTS